MAGGKSRKMGGISAKLISVLENKYKTGKNKSGCKGSTKKKKRKTLQDIMEEENG